MAAAVAAAAPVPVALHLDHVCSVDLLRQAPEHGFGSVMADFSALPYGENVAASRLYAHAPGARTDPAEAAEFVADTGLDALAVAVGSSHAMTSRDAALDHGLIETLRAAVPVPLVLHGSSGVPDEELRRAVAGGIVKVNIGTALNAAFTRALREHLAAAPAVVDPRAYLAPARAAMATAVAHFLGVLDST